MKPIKKKFVYDPDREAEKSETELWDLELVIDGVHVFERELDIENELDYNKELGLQPDADM